MEIKEIKIPKSKFKIYIKTLLDLENLFNKYNQKSESKKSVKDSGYLIYKKYYDDFKNKLYYSIFKSIINDENKFNSQLNAFYGNNNEIKFIPCEQKIFSNSKDLSVSLSLKNEYVIIDKLLWKMINNGKYNENIGKINFEIKDNKIILHFGNDDDVYFKYNLNIISNKNLLSKFGDNSKVSSQIKNHNNNDDETAKKLIINININNKTSPEKLVDKLYLSMIEYNNFEKLIMNKLKLNGNNNKEIMEGYFLEKDWFIKWKNYTDYDNNRFLLSDNNNEQEIKSKIKGKINQNIQSELFQKLVIKDFTKINFDSIKNDILILINDKFLGHFEKNLEYQEKFKIKFKIENHKFIFEMQNHDKKSLCSIKNILPMENNKCFRIANNLIELYIFQEQLKLRINKGKKDEKENLWFSILNFILYFS